MKRIKTLCVVLLIVFFGSVYVGAILPFIEGAKSGMTIAKYQLDHKGKTDYFILLDVVSKNYNYLEDSETNLKTGEKVLIHSNNITMIMQSVQDKPIWWKVLHVIYSFFSFFILILAIWVPFLVVRIVKSLQNSEVFDRKNLKRIQRIGVILLTVGVLSSIFQAINVYSAQSMVDLSHYRFSYAKVIDFSPIIMGVVILIMNEILRIGIEIKEEQDLTI